VEVAVTGSSWVLRNNSKHEWAVIHSSELVYINSVVCEPRHASWFAASMLEHRIARLAADPARSLGESRGRTPLLT
jgi:hypothetical protein